MNEPLHLISLGAGVQSSTLRCMDECNDPRLRALFPPSIASIIADTQQEPAEVYRWIEYLKKETTKSPIYVVTAGDLKADSLRLRVSKKTGQIYGRPLIPAYIKKTGGGRGLLGRKCTAEYKVRAIIKQVRKILGLEAMKVWRKRHAHNLKAWRMFVIAQKTARANKLPKPPFPHVQWKEMQADPLVVQWIGISTDEADRMKASREPWILIRHPLIEMGMSRDDCLAWMMARGFPEPPKSACKFCPFHSDEMWLDQKTNSPEEFAESVKFEQELNEALSQQTGTARLDGVVRFHDSLVPLDQINFAERVREEKRAGHTQIALFGNECEGMCGV